MPQTEEEKRNKTAERMRKMRGKSVTNSVTEPKRNMIIPEGVTLYRYIDGKRVELSELPEGASVLSDGQVWWPKKTETTKGNDRISFIQRELNDPYLVGSIDNAGRVLGDRYSRYEKAYRYKLWRDGNPVKGIDVGTAANLLQVCTSLNKHDVAHLVRYGINGPTMDIVSETLGAS